MALATYRNQIEQFFLPHPLVRSRPAIPRVAQMMHLPGTPAATALAHIMCALQHAGALAEPYWRRTIFAIIGLPLPPSIFVIHLLRALGLPCFCLLLSEFFLPLGMPCSAFARSQAHLASDQVDGTLKFFSGTPAQGLAAKCLVALDIYLMNLPRTPSMWGCMQQRQTFIRVDHASLQQNSLCEHILQRQSLGPLSVMRGNSSPAWVERITDTARSDAACAASGSNATVTQRK